MRRAWPPGTDNGVMADAGWYALRVKVHGRLVFMRMGPQVAGSIPLVDVPGYGHSAAWGHALGIPSLSWVLREVLDALGLERVVLVGNSMGGPVCLEVAHSAPERVVGIVLTSPAGGIHNQPLARALVQLARDVGRESPRMAPVVLRDYLRFGPLNALQL